MTFKILSQIWFVLGLPWWLNGKESACNAADQGLIPGSERSPGEGKWQPTPEFLPGEFYGQRSLLGYRTWDCRVGHDGVTNTIGGRLGCWFQIFFFIELLADKNFLLITLATSRIFYFHSPQRIFLISWFILWSSSVPHCKFPKFVILF